jgi:hypothetical protein
MLGSGERGTLINGVEVDARAVAVDRTGTETDEESPAQARSALDLPEILPTDFGSVRFLCCSAANRRCAKTIAAAACHKR